MRETWKNSAANIVEYSDKEHTTTRLLWPEQCVSVSIHRQTHAHLEKNSSQWLNYSSWWELAPQNYCKHEWPPKPDTGPCHAPSGRRAHLNSFLPRNKLLFSPPLFGNVISTPWLKTLTGTNENPAFNCWRQREAKLTTNQGQADAFLMMESSF